MPLKRLLARVAYDNVQYEIGDQIDIRDADLPQLESVGAIEDPPAPAGAQDDPPAASSPTTPKTTRRPKAAA